MKNLCFALIFWNIGLGQTGHPCKEGTYHEEVRCGKPRFRWDFCGPQTPAKELISVHLILSLPYFENCNINNFGLTVSRDQMWVHKWCYGTFLICFVPAMPFIPSTSRTYDTTPLLPTSPSSGKNLSGDSQTAKPTPETTAVLRTDKSQNQSTDAVTVTRTHILVTSPFHDDRSHTKSAPSPVGYRSPEAAPISTKNLLIIMAICVIGFIIIIIIIGAVVAYIRYNREESVRYKPRTRNDVASTAELVTSESDAATCISTSQPSVYDFIPFDKEDALPTLTGWQTTHCDEAEDTKKETKSSKPNDYSQIGKRETKSKGDDNTRRNIYSHTSIDTEYDHISQSTRRFHRSDSTYSHTYQFGQLNDQPEMVEKQDRLVSVSECEYAVLEDTKREP